MRTTLSAVLAALALAGAAYAAEAPLEASARRIEQACVARGEPPSVCACGVRIAREELDPKVFALIPEIEPLLDEKNQLLALSRLSAAIQESGLTLEDGVRAYDTIRANRARVKRECPAPAR